MKMKNYERIGIRLAEALYIEQGGLSYEEVKAIPFFTDETDVKRIHQLIQNKYNNLQKIYLDRVFRP